MWKQQLGLGFASAGIIIFAQPAIAQVTTITGVQVNATEDGVEFILETPSQEQPEIFRTQYGETLVIDLINTQLQLPDQEGFRQTNPVSGVASVEIVQQYQNSVRITLVGTEAVPTAKIVPVQDGLGLAVMNPSATVQPPPPAEEMPVEDIPPTPAEQAPIELVVTATRTEEESQRVPRSVTVIDREQIQQQATLSRNIQDILGQSVPGFGASTQRTFLTGQSLRGRRPLVLIDGVPQTSNFDAPQQELNSIDPAAVERIEVVRGPSAIYGGEAAGGVINIITRQPQEDQFKVESEVAIQNALTGEDDDFSNFIESTLFLNEQDLDVTFTISRNDTGNFFDAEGDLIPTAQGIDNSEILDVLGKIGVDITEDQRLQLTVNYYRDDQERDFISDPAVLDIAGIQPARPLDVDATIIGFSPEALTNTVINLDYQHDNLGGNELDGQFFYRNYESGQGIPQAVFPGFPAFVTQAQSEEWGGRLSIESPIGGSSSVLWGLDYINEDNSQDIFLFEETIEDDGDRAFTLTETGTETPPYDYESLGLFAQAEWEVSDSFIVSGGIRHERAGFQVDDYTGPSLEFLANVGFIPTANIEGGERDFNDTVFNLGAVYQVSNSVNIFANFAQSFSVPDIGRVLRLPQGFTSVEDEFPAIEPQKVDNYEIGIRGNWDNVQATLTGFFNESDLGLSLVVEDGLLQIVRAPERVYGVEATVDWQPSDKWQLGSTFTWQEGDSDPDDDGEFDPLTSSRISPIKLTTYVENQTTPGWRNRLQLVALGERDRAEEIDGTSIDGFITLDYISSIQLGAGTLQISVENLLNEDYFPVFSQLQAGGGNEVENFAARGTMLRVGYRLTW